MRFLKDSERRQMARKPANLEEVSREIEVSDTRWDEMLMVGPELLHFSGDIPTLDREIKRLRAELIGDIEMLALHVPSGVWFVVNTEGADYARYVGRTSIREEE